MKAGKPLLDVLAGKMPSRRPLWFMRQAGRYLPEYRAVRAKAGSFVKLCYTPEMAAEVTLQPLRRYDLDAAIVFADILVVPHAMGCDLDFVEGEGPKLSIVDTMDKVAALTPVREAWQTQRVAETLGMVKAGLPSHVALIGFCGGPWTVLSYMIEGGGTVERLNARRAALAQPDWFKRLMEMLIENSIDYLCAQIDAGAEAVQIFESWAGDVPWPLQNELVLQPLKRIREGVRVRKGNVPVIVFVRGAGQGHVTAAEIIGAEAVGVEQCVDMGWAAKAIPCAIQGNLDPIALAVGGAALDGAVERIAAAVPMAKHVFNLGHGIRQETDPVHVDGMIERVRAFDGV